MPASDAALYKAHVRNLRSVADGLSHIERDLNRAIADGNPQLSETLKKLYLLLAGAWAECRLKKLLYEPNGLSSDARIEISNQRSQSERWKKALELGYRKRYGVRRSPISELTVGGTAWFRYNALQDLIFEELNPLIELRNTLAHGQWARPLNSSESDISQNLIASMAHENALTVKFKLSLIGSLSALIHDLVAATSFERDFDTHFRRVIITRTNLQRRSYQEWERSMVEKKVRGRQRRDQAIKAAE